MACMISISITLSLPPLIGPRSRWYSITTLVIKTAVSQGGTENMESFIDLTFWMPSWSFWTLLVIAASTLSIHEGKQSMRSRPSYIFDCVRDTIWVTLPIRLQALVLRWIAIPAELPVTHFLILNELVAAMMVPVSTNHIKFHPIDRWPKQPQVLQLLFPLFPLRILTYPLGK